MPTADDIRWFKEQFHEEIKAATAGTPFDLDMLTALACQETGEIWPILRKNPNLGKEQIVALCVGDTLDDDRGRRAFPRNKAALVAARNGQAMFDIAHQALRDVAVHIPSYRAAAKNANKFVHGYGVWQFDLQFFKDEPEYFLEKRYEKLEATLGKALGELKDALRKIGFGDKPSLDDKEMAFVAIAYNTGGFKPSKGLKQGFFDGTLFYGEAIFRFIRLARTVALPGGTPAIAPPDPGKAIVAPPTSIAAPGPAFHVDTQESPLRLRSEPKISKPSGKNVITNLPDGHPVRAVTGTEVNGFLEVETSLFGANLRGFASQAFLKRAARGTDVPVVTPADTPPQSGIVAVTMPRKEGTVTRRKDIADSHSLNEPGQPGRTGTTTQALVAELGEIIAWLAVDKPAHKRYQPRDGLTFCNIYTHDYCYLARQLTFGRSREIVVAVIRHTGLRPRPRAVKVRRNSASPYNVSVSMALSSMTGFARGHGISAGYSWAWELKSVNGKGLDLRLRLPAGWDAIEPPVRAKATDMLARGTIYATLTVERRGAPAQVRVNEEVLSAVLAVVKQLSGRIDAERPRLDGLLAIKGVVDVIDAEEREDERRAVEAAVTAGFAAVLEGLVEMRRREGEALGRILSARLDEIAVLIGRAEAAAARRLDAVKQRIAEQVAVLMEASDRFDPDRLHQEAVLIAAKADVREELDRLAAHVEQAQGMVAKGGAVGRRLDFLSQEFNRESNTLCAKANDADLTNVGLALKGVVEQFREQVQNLE